jgi:hypothetical protein
VIAAASLAATALLLGVPGPDPVGAQAPSSAAAVRAQELASDPDAPGPIQPIPFSHALHAGTFQIQCLYCHSGTDRSMAAGVPSVESCMGCHSQFGGDLEGIQILKRHWDEKRPVEWVQIHRLPEHVQFPHQRHVAAGVECNTCHGPVETLHKLHLVPDTKWWPWGLPARKLQMGWCISCHRETGVSQDCFGCHY